jgi:murein DD-endopeptidase MepM/ murein hydrolase activator NlpD
VARLLERDRQQAAQAALTRAASDAGNAPAAGTGPGADAGFAPRVGVPYTCPVGPVHSFVDTWGAPRAGGRRHEGTDVFAPYGSGVYAIVDGVADRVGDDGGRGGLRIWVRADNGDRFYYAHNSALLVRPGQRVRTGQLIARVGRSGDAATTPPHVHFETHPGGGPAVDSYPFLRAACTGGR